LAILREQAVQKAVIVRTVMESADAESWSHEVDATSDSPVQPLRHYLANGWKVAHTCPMPSELDSCCLVILESPDAAVGPRISDVDRERERRDQWRDGRAQAI
jgi:hypothetical protein